MNAVTKLLDQPSAAEMRQVAFIEDKIHFSSAFGHRKQNTPRGAFDSGAKNGVPSAIFQEISPHSKPFHAFLRIIETSELGPTEVAHLVAQWLRQLVSANNRVEPFPESRE